MELEGKGRVLMEVASVEPIASASPEPSPGKRKVTNRRKRRPGGSSPEKKLGSHEARLENPNWPDTEFPWRLRTEERNEEAKAVQDERLRWIERYLDRESDEEDDDQLASHNSHYESAIVQDRDSRTSYQVKMGRGKMIPLSVAPDDPWNLIPKQFFPLDPADAREALLSKKRVRTLSYRQQKRKRQEEEDDDDDDEVLCICHGKDDGRQLVQCDSCQMWYHLECIGIKNIATLGREEDPWFCGRCARSRSPSTDVDDPPSSEPIFVPTELFSMSRRSSDATFFQPAVPESPNWSSIRMPRTPTRSSVDSSKPPWNWTDSGRPTPSTPRQHHLVAKTYNTPGPSDYHGANFSDDSPFDPSSTPSRGIKFHVPFATPKATSWRPNPLLQTPSRINGKVGTNKYHLSHSASLDDNNLSVGSAIQYSFARVLPSDESPIRRNRSSDATFGRRRFLSPARPIL